jgi:hypothetical protein
MNIEDHVYQFWKRKKFYCRTCKHEFEVILQSNGNPLLSCKCDQSHTRFLWWRSKQVWLVWDKNKPILAHPHENIIGSNRFLAQRGDWREATEADKPPIMRTAFIFR